MMRVVLDTNILVAALRSGRGASNALLIETFGGKASWLCSVPLFLEYEDVLTRAEFLLATGHGKPEIVGLLSDVATVIEPVDLHFLWRPQLRDPKDEMVLETAVNGRADFLVTHNIRDFAEAANRFEVDVVRPQEMLRRIRQ
jgi:putative PIN family toxin of toxin-antitoxin system